MKLKEARFKKNVTQWDLWKATNIHQSRISLIENDYILPTEKEKELIASALGFSMDAIIWPCKRKNNCHG